MGERETHSSHVSRWSHLPHPQHRPPNTGRKGYFHRTANYTIIVRGSPTSVRAPESYLVPGDDTMAEKSIKKQPKAQKKSVKEKKAAKKMKQEEKASRRFSIEE